VDHQLHQRPPPKSWYKDKIDILTYQTFLKKSQSFLTVTPTPKVLAFICEAGLAIHN
jgi:hypothetical protein